MRTLTAQDFDALTAALDLMLLAIWMLTLLSILAAAILGRLWQRPGPKYRLSIPKPMTKHFWAWLLPLAVVLRLPGMFDSAWYDETFTGVMAALPLDRFAVALGGDVHPPLYYLAAKLSTMILGHNDFAIRMPAFIAGVLLIPAMYRLAQRLTDDLGSAQIVAVIVALLPGMIHYSSEARYPTALALMVVLSMIAIIEKRWLLWAVATSVLPGLHAAGVLYAAALAAVVIYQTVGLLLRLRDNPTFALSVTNAATGAVVVVAGSIGLAVAFMMSQVSDVANGFWLWKMNPLTHFTEGTVLSPAMPAGILAYIAVILMTIIGAIALYRLPRHRLMLLAVASVPGAIFVLGLVWHPVYLPRAMMASTLVSVVGWGILARRQLVYQVAVCLALMASLPFAFRADEVQLSDVMKACTGADYVATTATNMTIIALHYAPEGSQVLAWAGGNNTHQALSFSAREAMGFDFLPPELMAGQICLVTQWNYHMEDTERQRLVAIKKVFGPAASRDVFKASDFIIYEVSRWNN